MSEHDCEAVRLALEVRRGGESPTIPAEALDRHLAACAGCRREEAEALEVDALFAGVVRRRPEAPGLWPDVERRLPRPAAARAAAAVVAIVLLVATRWLETAPLSFETVGLKLLPLGLAAAILGALRESPARIPTEFSAP